MATLTADISADDNLIRVSGATLTEPRLWFRLDDELLDLYGWDRKQLSGGYRDAGLDTTRWFVTRGVGGTTAATHSAGTELLAAASALVSGDDTETSPLPFAGEGAGEQTIRLLGPYPITVALLNTGTTVSSGKKIRLEELEAGITVVTAWIVMTDGWELGTNPARVRVGVDLDSDEFDMVDAVQYEGSSEVLGAGAWDSEPGEQDGVTVSRRIVQRSSLGHLFTYARNPSAGQYNVYALIAEPAS